MRGLQYLLLLCACQKSTRSSRAHSLFPGQRNSIILLIRAVLRIVQQLVCCAAGGQPFHRTTQTEPSIRLCEHEPGLSKQGWEGVCSCSPAGRRGSGCAPPAAGARARNRSGCRRRGKPCCPPARSTAACASGFQRRGWAQAAPL